MTANAPNTDVAIDEEVIVMRNILFIHNICMLKTRWNKRGLNIPRNFPSCNRAKKGSVEESIRWYVSKIIFYHTFFVFFFFDFLAEFHGIAYEDVISERRSL